MEAEQLQIQLVISETTLREFTFFLFAAPPQSTLFRLRGVHVAEGGPEVADFPRGLSLDQAQGILNWSVQLRSWH